MFNKCCHIDKKIDNWTFHNAEYSSAQNVHHLAAYTFPIPVSLFLFKHTLLRARTGQETWSRNSLQAV